MSNIFIYIPLLSILIVCTGTEVSTLLLIKVSVLFWLLDESNLLLFSLNSVAEYIL